MLDCITQEIETDKNCNYAGTIQIITLQTNKE